MASIQNLFSLPGQTAANAGVMPLRSIAPGAPETQPASSGAFPTLELTGDAISSGFENIIETVLAKAPSADAIDLKASPDLAAFFNSSFFPSADGVSQSLLATTAMPQAKQGASVPMIDLLAVMQALQPAPLITSTAMAIEKAGDGNSEIVDLVMQALQPAQLTASTAMTTENAGDGNSETDVPGDTNPALAISKPVLDGVAESIWPAPMPVEPVAGEFIALTAPVMQPSNSMLVSTREASAAPALHAAAFSDTGAELQLATGDAKEISSLTTKINSAPVTTSEIDMEPGPVPPSQSNAQPSLTPNAAPPVISDVSDASADLLSGISDEAGNTLAGHIPAASNTALEILPNIQRQSEPAHLSPEQKSQPAASPAPVPVITPTPQKLDIVGKNRTTTSGDAVTPEKKPGEAQSAKRSNAGYAKEGGTLDATPIGAAPDLVTAGTSQGNAIPQSVSRDASQTPGQSAPSSLMAALTPQPLIAVPNSSNPSALQNQTVSSADPRGGEQTALRNIAAPQSQGTASATPNLEQNAMMAQPAAADGQNFVQTMGQLSGPAPDPAQQASQPAAPDMVQGAIGNTSQIDKQDALRSALPQVMPRSEPHPTPLNPPIRDISVHISQHADTGMNRFQLRLDPPELGRVDVRMEISSEGKLSAVIAVERPETLDLLQRDSRALERSLIEAGLKTDSGSLSFSLKGGRHENQDTDRSRQGQGGSGNDLTDEWDEPIAPAAMRFANRSVNIRI